MARYTADTIAKWMLAYNREKADAEGADLISNLKLQKLLYYAQGTYLGITGHPLFDDPIVAWEHGPVIVDIYHQYRDNHSKGIDFTDDFDFSQILSQDEAILEAVYENFGQYSAWKLRNMTHTETPWKSTPRNHIIDTKLIRDYFVEHYIEE